MEKSAKELTTIKLSILLNDFAKFYEVENIDFAKDDKYVSVKAKKDKNKKDEYILFVKFLKPMKNSTKQVLISYLDRNIKVLYKKETVIDKERNIVSFHKKRFYKYIIEDPFKDKILN